MFHALGGGNGNDKNGNCSFGFFGLANGQLDFGTAIQKWSPPLSAFSAPQLAKAPQGEVVAQCFCVFWVIVSSGEKVEPGMSLSGDS